MSQAGRLFLSVLSLIGCVSLALGADEPDLRAGLAKCAAIKESVARLDCYDTLARKAGASSPIQSAVSPDTPSGGTTSAPVTYSVRCQQTTKSGVQCKRNASPGSKYCWQHGG